ncbi:MAG: hypothetical protein WBD27_01910 [Pyrinomonadaceae bacterium]
MIDAGSINEIIALYTKHGWTLRRVLLSEQLRKNLSTTVADIFGGVEVARSELDAAWFSRSSRPDCTAWEIRHLSENPFALVEVIDRETDDEEAEETFRKTEAKMLEMTAKRPRAN